MNGIETRYLSIGFTATHEAKSLPDLDEIIRRRWDNAAEELAEKLNASSVSLVGGLDVNWSVTTLDGKYTVIATGEAALVYE